MKTVLEDAAEIVSAPDASDRRYVYNGDPFKQLQGAMPRGNRPVRKRQRSLFTIVALLFVVSAFIVLYVANKLTVNRLAVEVHDLQTQYENILYANEAIRAEINKKSSLERISSLATSQLGMIYPKEQPLWFELRADLAERVPEKR